AVLFMIFGYGQAICLKAMAVFEALGFFSAYAVLRRCLARPVAVAICLILISSSALFARATQEVFPAYPLLFTTMTALLVFHKYESASSLLRRFLWGIGLTSLLAASLMIASAAMALAGSLMTAAVMTFFTDRQLGMIRLRRIAPVFL